MPLYPVNSSDRRPGTEDSLATDPFSEQESGKNSLISLLMGGAEIPELKEMPIEVLSGYTGYQNGSQQLENILVNPVSPQRENDDFMLHLVEEIIKMNQGMMEINGDDEKLITMISLVFPMEKRRTVHYQSTTA